MDHISRAVLLSVLLVGLAGCLGFVGDDADDTNDGADLHEDVLAQLSEVEPPSSVEGTRTTEWTANGETDTLSQQFWLRDDGTSRTENEWTDVTGIWINDGERIWTYTAGESTGTVYDITAPVNSDLESAYEQTQQYFESYDVESIEETTLEGHDVYHIVFEPESDESTETVDGSPAESPVRDPDDIDTLELWLEQDHLYLVQYHRGSQNFETTYSYEELAFDVEIDDDRFAVPDDIDFETVDDP